MNPRIKVRGHSLFSFVTVTALKETEIQCHFDLFELTTITSKISSDIESYQSYRNTNCIWHEKKYLIQKLLTLSKKVHREMEQLQSNRASLEDRISSVGGKPISDEVYEAYNAFSKQRTRVINTIKTGLAKLHKEGGYTIYGFGGGRAPANKFQQGNTNTLQRPLEYLLTLLSGREADEWIFPVQNDTVNNPAGSGGSDPSSADTDSSNGKEIEMKPLG